MSSRFLYAISGAIIGAITDILIALLTAGIQQKAFPQQFSGQSLWILAALVIVGLLVAYWLGKKIEVPVTQTTQSSSTPTQSTSKTSAKKGDV